MQIRRQVSRLLQDRSGNFGLMTALLATPVLLACGAAVDISNAMVERANMQEAADAAALAGGSVYDGTNPDEAKARAQEFISAYSDRLPVGATFEITTAGQTVEVSVSGDADNAFMQLAGIDSLPIGVASVALSPMKPKSIKLTPTKAQGYYYKKVSILVVRPGSNAEQVVATVTYQPETQEDSGQGEMTVEPSGTIDLGKYSKLVLQMDIKNDGCALDRKAHVANRKIKCTPSKAATDRKYDLTLRTDEPETTHYLFVDGKQLPKGVTSPLATILDCGKTSDHAWEDGGGWERQDFFYTAVSECAPDGEFVRLTK
jgi:Flp pilus assembly protein TadG